MKNNDLPSISALPQDGNFWRIDWFGDLAFPNRSIRRTQPSLLVHLSRVVDTKFLDNSSVLLSSDSTSAARFQRKVWISVGVLPLLRIGDIWCDGRLKASPDYQLATFTEVRIGDSTVSLIKAGLNLDEKGFLLPLSEHPWHLQCTHSYCVMVDLPENRRLIIPCIELIRFYFGSSSSLITKLFLPPLERKALYRNAQYNEMTGRLVLELAEKISGASAADLGRLHLNPVAWRTALHISTSALKASLVSQNVYPQAFFPFEGETTLIAAGKWLSFGDQPRATFVVFNLRSCSHPFPFRSLHYKIQNDSENARVRRPASETGTRTNLHGSAQDSSSQEIVETDSSNNLLSKTTNVRLAPRFPDLQKKSIWKNKLLSTGQNEKFINGSGAAITRVAVGDSGSEQRIRSIDLAIALDPKAGRRPVPDFLQVAVSELVLLKDCKVELLTQSDKDGWTVPIAVQSDNDGEIDLRLFVEDDFGRLHLRRACVFSVCMDERHCCLAFIDAEPAIHTFHTMLGKRRTDVSEILCLASDDFLSELRVEPLCVTELIKEIFGTDSETTNLLD